MAFNKHIYNRAFIIETSKPLATWVGVKCSGIRVTGFELLMSEKQGRLELGLSIIEKVIFQVFEETGQGS